MHCVRSTNRRREREGEGESCGGVGDKRELYTVDITDEVIHSTSCPSFPRCFIASAASREYYYALRIVLGAPEAGPHGINEVAELK